MSERGERGPTGDHGQAGDDGVAGARGRPGVQGPPGPRYSSWLTRHVVKAYVLLWAGVVAAFIFSSVLNNRTTDEIKEQARTQCESANHRSDIQREDFTASAEQVQRLDIERLFGIDAATAAEFRALSKASAERRIASLPYFDCNTGKRVPPPPLPPMTTP